MLSDSDAAYLGRLRTETVDILRRAIGGAKDVALLDAPNQRNVGDSLIWAGELAYLKRLGVRVRYVADIAGYDPRELRAALPRGGVVLLHGGGNFGDLWPGHQRHREHVIADLPDHAIVQLPQSVFFGSREAASRANDALSRHPQFTVLLRDRESMARAEADLPDVVTAFCYDMALGYEPPRRAVDTVDRVLVIGRQDVERSSGLADVGPDWLDAPDLVRTDWGPVGGTAGLRWRIARAVAKADHRLARTRRAGRMPLPRFAHRAVHRAAQRAIADINAINIDNALALYADSKLVIVDRLHAHVLAGLLGIDHIALDNNYRKIGSVYDEYSGGLSTARYATSLESARLLANDLVGA